MKSNPINTIEENDQLDIGYVGIGVGVIGIAIAISALVISRKK